MEHDAVELVELDPRAAQGAALARDGFGDDDGSDDDDWVDTAGEAAPAPVAAGATSA